MDAPIAVPHACGGNRLDAFTQHLVERITISHTHVPNPGPLYDGYLGDAGTMQLALMGSPWDGMQVGGIVSYIVHCARSNPCEVNIPQACVAAHNDAKTAQHELYEAVNAADKRMDFLRNQYADIELTGKAPLWVRGMNGLGAIEAINDQVSVTRANKAYKAAEKAEYNACPQVKFG